VKSQVAAGLDKLRAHVGDLLLPENDDEPDETDETDEAVAG
jgi:hypothetical protein